MKHALRIILDTLFPPTVHERRLRAIAPDTFALALHPTVVFPHLALSHYDSPAVQAAVAACKFENNSHAASLLATLFARWLSHQKQTGITVIIPLPLSTNRQKERGFNQVERVVRAMPPIASLRIESTWLVRTHHTAPQTSLDRSGRLQNMSGAFSVRLPLTNCDWGLITRVIICDDVLTTGATLTAARTALAPHLPPSVELVTLAWAH